MIARPRARTCSDCARCVPRLFVPAAFSPRYRQRGGRTMRILRSLFGGIMSAGLGMLVAAGCSNGGANTSGSGAGSGTGGNPMTNPDAGPAPGNPDGHCAVPPEAQAEDSSKPAQVVGDGS